MNLKMKKNSIFALLLRTEWWVSGAIALVIGIVAWALMPRQYALYGIFTGMPFMVVSLIGLRSVSGIHARRKLLALLPEGAHCIHETSCHQ